METNTIIVNVRGVRKLLRNIGKCGRVIALTMLGMLAFFTTIGLLGILQSQMMSSPVSSMKGMAASVSSRFFMDMIGMEIPYFNSRNPNSTFSQQKVASFLFQFVTNINPQDPKTLIAREVPGMAGTGTILLRKGLATDFAVTPEDYTPSKEALNHDSSPDGAGVKPLPGGAAGDVSTTPPQSSPIPPASQSPSPETAGPIASSGAAKPTTNGRKVILIYHSHNRESWVPELGIKDPDAAYSATTNITLVGERLADKLNDLGVGAVDYHTDYSTAIKDFNYLFSYKYSLQTVKEAMAANPDIKFLFDIHRDSGKRENTTVEIDGIDYAQIYFIIGHNNPGWQKNEEFATQIHQLLEQKAPGISRGIYGKSSDTGNGEYNQSVSPDSVLIEIGGPFNTLKECYRTADLLAEVIADFYWQAEKVNTDMKAAVAAR